jgi:hypothetical protein
MKLQEFSDRLDQIHGVFMDSCTAFLLLSSKIDELYPNNEDSISFASGTRENSIVRQSVKIKDFKDRIKLGGQDIKIVTCLCVVSIYQLWEDEYRNLISQEKNIKRDELLLDVFGDIRIIRNSIIHHKGKRSTGFSKIKKLSYMREREEVIFSDTEFHELIATIKTDLTEFKKA